MKSLLILFLLIPFLGNRLVAFDQTHKAWDRIVSKHVRGSGFDYAGLKSGRGALDSYLDSLSRVGETEFKSWSDGNRLAFLLNLYNAATVRLVLDHHPVKSIREIGGGMGPWKQPVVRVFGGKVTLDHVEHVLIRGNFAEPRIHFAVNCASVGCPPLRDEAFTGEKLEVQLREQTESFLKDRKVNRLDGRVLRLSPLFDWFKEDFTRKGQSVPGYVAPYFKKSEQKLIRQGVQVEFGDYDWSLNGALRDGVASMAAERIIVMTRFPELGKVKTRLAATVGDERALEVHDALARHAIAEARAWGGELEIHVAGGDKAGWLNWLGMANWIEQGGGDLGERLQNAVQGAFRDGVERLVVMGSDCPGLDREVLKKAFQVLRTSACVFGPALDGGYYLVGMNGPRPDLFDDVDWGGGEVLKQSLAKEPEAALLDPLSDVDVEADLIAWKGR